MDRYRSASGKPTIGLLTTLLNGDEIRASVLKGVMDEAKERGVNLIVFAGNELKPDETGYFKGNLAFDLASRENVDGLIIWTSALANFIGLKGLRSFCERYKPLPIIDLDPESMDKHASYDYSGMKAAVLHLIRDHGRKAIAFIPGAEGNTVSEYRFLGYKDALTESGLPFDPALVAPPDWWLEDSGQKAVRILLDTRKAGFSGLAAAGDLLAIGAIETLKERGKLVPEEISVIGFDGISRGTYLSPPLSSVEGPSYRLGRQAVETALAALGGRASQPERIPVKLVIRESCGCQSKSFERAGGLSPRNRAAGRSGGTFGAVDESGSDKVGKGRDSGETISRKLFAALREDSGFGAKNAFLPLFKKCILDRQSADSDLAAWNDALSTIRNLALASFSALRMRRAENYLHQARVLLHEAALRDLAEKNHKKDQMNEALLTAARRLNATFDFDEIMDVVAEEFPKLGFGRYSISLFEDPSSPMENARQVLSGNERGKDSRESAVKGFSTKLLVPAGLADNDAFLAVLPFYFQKEQLGFMVVDVGIANVHVAETIRAQISVSIKGSLLIRKIKDGATILEEGVAALSSTLEEIARNVDMITGNMVRQAAAVEEIAGSIEQMSKNITSTTGMSERVRSCSLDLNQASSDGSTCVEDSIGAIKNVSGNSAEILELLDLIKNIAEQTNILAMNAAIEAAHSGEYGRGFSVVAEEMRKLADDTNRNISHIERAVHSIISLINTSVELSVRAGTNLEKIIAYSKQNGETAGSLNDVMMEQDSGAKEVLQATRELVKITEEVKLSMIEQKHATDDFYSSLRELRDRGEAGSKT